MAEFIDYMFIFWVLVTIGVYVLGSIYEKQVKNKSVANKRPAGNHQQHARPSFSAGQQYEWSSYSSPLGPTNSSATASNHYNQHYSSQYAGPQSSSLSSSSPAGAYYSAAGSSGEPYTNQSAAYSSYIANEYRGEPTNRRASGQQVTGSRPGDYYGAGGQSGGGDFMSPPAGRYHDQASNLNDEQRQSHGLSSLSAHDYPGAFGRANLSYDAIDSASIPTATGFNSDCVEWVNSILYLFYTQAQKYGPIITENIYRSLNEKLSNITSSTPEYSDLVIEFCGVNRQLSTRPELTNIRTESESDKSVSAICKIYNKQITFELMIQRARMKPIATSYGLDSDLEPFEDRNETVYYELTLEDLEGKLKSVAMLNDKLIVVQFMEKPDTKISLRNCSSHLHHHQQQQHHSRLPLINEDTLVSMILQTLTQVVVDLYFGDDLDFPQYKSQATSGSHSGYRNKLNLLKGGASELKRQIKHDFFGALSSSSSADSKERKVFVKILKAKNINYNQNVTCLLELDQPHQQALSSTKQGSNPFWDEHFLFTINDKSGELVIELWDSLEVPPQAELAAPPPSFKKSSKSAPHNNKRWQKAELTSNGKFLGLARVNIDELRRNPVQKVSLMLESNRQEGALGGVGGGDTPAADLVHGRSLAMSTDLNNSVGGELQVELLFLEHAPSSPSSSPFGVHKSNSTSSIRAMEGDVVSVDRKLTPSGYVITTTTITKPAGQQKRGKGAASPLARRHSENRHERLSVRNQSAMSSGPSDQSDLELDGISSQADGGQSATARRDEMPVGDDSERAARSRSRSRSRSFLRAIKKRFSFSRSRSEAPSPVSNDRLETGSIESRSRASSELSMGGGGQRAKSVPTSRAPGEVPMIVINRGRPSDTASAFTFAHPKSQLVIECTEPKMNPDGSVQQRGRVRHYAIPESAANKGKWRKRGLKFHLVNEHQFVACHLDGSSTCHLCGRMFSRRPGKQGYKCRQCHLLSHKQCHVKVDHNCPYATKDGLQLEYIDADPPAALLDGKRASSNEALHSQQQASRRMKMGAKSISVDIEGK